jgi:anthranilate synthase component I
MIVSPEYDQFASAYQRGESQVVSTRLVADLETPVSAMLKLGRKARYSFLLESVEGGAVRGRYSIIGLNPDIIWKAQGSTATINRKALADVEGPFEDAGSDPLASLRALLKESRIKLPVDAPPMAAGVFGYLG